MSLAEAVYDLAERWDAARSVIDVENLDFKETDVEEFNANQKSQSIL